MQISACLLLLCLALGPRGGVHAQVETVSIAAPVEGQTIAGRVSIAGAATSPLFQRYEVEFGYEPNPTGTWFPIGEPVQAQQAGGILAEWDTLGLGIADGVYTLRLRVYRVDGTFAEALARNLQLRNGASAIAGTLPAFTEGPTATATSILIELPPTSTPRPTGRPTVPGPAAPPGGGPAVAVTGPTFDLLNFGRAFLSGIGWTAGAFALIGLYAALRPRVRPHLWRLMRRLAKSR
jgi:hypothetical protein